MKYRGSEIGLCIFLCAQYRCNDASSIYTCILTALLFGAQYFPISSIDYVIFLTDHPTELLEILPGIMDIKLIAMPPDVK